jgi:hypothetical protein
MKESSKAQENGETYALNTVHNAAVAVERRKPSSPSWGENLPRIGRANFFL